MGLYTASGDGKKAERGGVPAAFISGLLVHNVNETLDALLKCCVMLARLVQWNGLIYRT